MLVNFKDMNKNEINKFRMTMHGAMHGSVLRFTSGVI